MTQGVDRVEPRRPAARHRPKSRPTDALKR